MSYPRNAATLVIVNNPFNRDDRTLRAIPRRRRLAALAPKTDSPFICLYNGEPVLRAAWKRTRVKRGDIVTFIVLPQGGGGGGGSDPLRMVLMIAVMVAAPYAAGWSSIMTGGALGAAGSVGFSLTTAAFGMLGNALINAVLPPPRQPSTQQAAQLAAPSPTYSLPGQQGNSARIGLAIPVQYGRHPMFPDYAAQPYYENIANDQYGNFLFCLGQGQLQIEQIRFDKTDISAFGGDVVYEIVPPGGTVTLFPTNVDTSSDVAGQELPGRKDLAYSQSGTTITVTETAHGRTMGAVVSFTATSGSAVSGDFAIASVVDVDTWTLTAAAALTTSGNAEVLSYIGGTGFITNAAGTLANQICLDVAMPSGLGLINQSTGAIEPASVTFYAEAQPIDANGQPVGDWFHLPTHDREHLTMTTFNQAVSQATAGSVTYSVVTSIALSMASTDGHVVKRAGVMITGWTLSAGTGPAGVDEILIPAGHQINYSLISTVAWEISYIDPTTVIDQTITEATNTPQRRSYFYSVAPGRYRVRMARRDVKNTATTAMHSLNWVAMKAFLPGEQSYGNVTMMAMRVRAGIMTATAVQKVNVISTRCLPIWNATTGWSDPVPTRSIAWALADVAKSEYGGRQIDAQLDLPALAALDAQWEARGDYFNGIFDNAVSLWEALTSVARAGRAKPFRLAGVLKVRRTQAQQAPVALFSTHNTQRDSLVVDYAFPDESTTDSVEVTYFDEDVWAQRTVMCTLPGGTANNPSKVPGFGITNRDQAHREGIHMAACNKYQRKIIKLGTEMDGFIPIYGDLVALQQDIPGWGQSAEVIAHDSVAGELVLSESFTWTAGAQHYLGFRNRNGSLTDAIPVAPGSAPDRVLLQDNLPVAYLDVGGDRLRTIVSFGPGETWRQQVIVTQVTPRSLDKVELTCVNEAPIVHTIENDVPTPPWVGW